jgi:hypothetical protein
VTAPVVALDPHDFEHEQYPAFRALQGLMDVHGLPQFDRMSGVKRHGWKVAVVSVAADSAEPWRRALGAPAFTSNPDIPGQMMTERFWFSTWIRIAYSTPEVDNG